MYSLEKRIKKALTDRGMSVDELAERSAISRTTIYNIFKSLDFNLSSLEKIREVLDVPMSYFFIEEESIKVDPQSLQYDKIYQSLIHYKIDDKMKTIDEFKTIIIDKDEQIKSLIEDMRLKNKLLQEYMEENERLKENLNPQLK